MSSHPVKYRPPWAPHIDGSYTERVVDEDGIPEEQKVEAKCETCGAIFKRTCASGMVRQHISTFAAVHAHRDVLNDPFPGRVR